MKMKSPKQHTQRIKMELIKRSGILIPKHIDDQMAYIKIKESLERRSKSYTTSTYIINTFLSLTKKVFC